MKITPAEAIRILESYMKVCPPRTVLGEAIAMAANALREQEEKKEEGHG